MKTRSLLFGLLSLLLLAMEGCGSGSATHNATGMIYEVVVVMDKAAWTSPAGEAIKAQLHSDVPGLPQSEASFKITYCTPDQFNNLLTYVRNILIVKIDSSQYTKVSLKAERDRYAKNQLVMVMNAPSIESIVEHMQTHPTSIIDYFNQVEIDRMINIYSSQYSSLVMKHDNLSYNICGILLLIFANILDCVDGQLARLTGIKSAIGRILDGFAGDIWFASIYVAFALRLSHD